MPAVLVSQIFNPDDDSHESCVHDLTTWKRTLVFVWWALLLPPYGNSYHLTYFMTPLVT